MYPVLLLLAMETPMFKFLFGNLAAQCFCFVSESQSVPLSFFNIFICFSDSHMSQLIVFYFLQFLFINGSAVLKCEKAKILKDVLFTLNLGNLKLTF
jgi:hypothetical protein